jgi:organic radical activating enzyme
MSKIKVSELFYSIQGEGRYVGVPSIFLRTFGCNFTCGGFGMPKGEKSNERNEVDVSLYKSYNDLPLVRTGCDSYASWDPRFKHLSPVVAVDGLAQSIVELLPHKGWVDEHLVITGGEPLLGWQRAYRELLTQPCMLALKELTFETNGTQELSDERLVEYLMLNFPFENVTFSVSPKLSVSGEKWEDAIKPEIVVSYEQVGYTYLKFVVATEDDAAEADRAVEAYRDAGFEGPVYLMPVGGTEEIYYLNNRQVAELAMKRGYRYSPRLQVDLFRNAWGT